MSMEYGRLCGVILEHNYGPHVKAVAGTLFPTKWKTLKMIVSETGLSTEDVSNALAQMINCHFIVFRISEHKNKSVVEYCLQYDEILWTIRFPKYIKFMKEKYGPIGEFVTYTIVMSGCQSVSELICECLSSPDVTNDVKEIRAVLQDMITQQYFIRLPAVAVQSSNQQVAPTFAINNDLNFKMPKINLQTVAIVSPEKAKDKDILWRINSGRFHQEFRDQIIVEAVKNKLGGSVSECVALILKYVFESDGSWVKDVSQPFTRSEIKTYLEANCVNPQVLNYVNHYLTLLSTDSLGIIRNINDNTNELFVVDWARIFLNLTSMTLEEIVGRRFGPKARRIFCIIRSKPFIEQSELHKDVMMSDKECKTATYTLIKENFIHIRSVRKVGSSAPSQSNISYLFHLKTTKLVQSILITCYKAMQNHILRAGSVKKQNKIIMDKVMNVNLVTELVEQNLISDSVLGEDRNIIMPFDEIQWTMVQKNINIMLTTIQDIDETIFQLEMYLYHSANVQLVKPFIQFNITA